MTAIYAKYGLQGQSFATLPTLKNYHLLKQKALEIITIDIRKELLMLAMCPTHCLQMVVPTMGFTDPLLDHSPVPRFAVPLSINGFVADEGEGLQPKALVWGIDIADNHYPLLRNHRGKIDYELIQKARSSSSLFSTLRAIMYRFQAPQIQQGQGLISHKISSLQGMAELLLFYRSATPLTFSIEIINEQGERVHSRQIGYYPQQTPLPQANYRYQQHIIGEIMAHHTEPYFRSRWQCDISVNGKTTRLMQAAGLSYSALFGLLTRIIPAQHFFKVFTQQNGSHRSENRFCDFPQYQSVFYQLVIESVLDQSLPLMTLQDFFLPPAPDVLLALYQSWDTQDKKIAENLLKNVNFDALIDLIDEFIALRDPLCFATFELPSAITACEIEALDLSCALEDRHGQWHALPVTHHSTILDTFSVYADMMKSNALCLKGASLRERRRP